MGFKSTKDVLERLNSPENLPNKLRVIEEKNNGRPEGAKEVPLEIKKLIGITAQDSSAAEVARAFGVSDTSASNYARGMINQVPNEELKESLKQAEIVREGKREEASDKAIGLLLSGLNLLEEEGLGTKKSKTVVSVAKDLASINEKLRKKTPLEALGANNGGGIQFILNVPPVKKVDDYEIVEVS